MATVQKQASGKYLGRARVSGFKAANKSFDKKADALAWAEAMERDLKSMRITGDVSSDVTQMLMAKLIAEFKADPAQSGKKAFHEMDRLLDWWSENAGTVRTLEFGAMTIRQCRKKLDDQILPGGGKRSPSTVNRYLSAARKVWNWGRANGLVPANRVWPPGLMHPEAQFSRKRFLSEAELDALLTAAESDPTMRAMILFSVATGLRQAETYKLLWSDVDFNAENPRVVVRDAKNGETRGVHLNGAAVAALKALKKDRITPPTTPVFLNSEGAAFRKESLLKRWYVIRNAAGLTDFRWHDLRHSTASFLAQDGASLFQIGERLRHKSVSMTKRYSHLVDGAAVTGDDKLSARLSKSATQSA